MSNKNNHIKYSLIDMNNLHTIPMGEVLSQNNYGKISLYKIKFIDGQSEGKYAGYADLILGDGCQKIKFSGEKGELEILAEQKNFTKILQNRKDIIKSSKIIETQYIIGLKGIKNLLNYFNYNSL